MKRITKRLLAGITVCVLLFAFPACAAGPNAAGPDASAGINDVVAAGANSNEPPANSTPAPGASSVAGALAAGPSLTEAQAADISLKLYEEGYIPFYGFLWGGGGHLKGWDWDKSFTRDGWTYYRFTEYASREALEAAFSGAFTEAFVRRNVARLFEELDYFGRLQLIEQDGELYRVDPGGIGGTFLLATETLEISSLSASGWTFAMHGIDPHDANDGLLEELTCTFQVTGEGEQWQIESFEIGFDDGSGHSEF